MKFQSKNLKLVGFVKSAKILLLEKIKMNILQWIRGLFKKKEFDVDEFIKESKTTLKEKLKIIYKLDSYKKAKKEIFEEYREFKIEHKDKIGKMFESDFGVFRIIKVKEPWFLKSPILIDNANFKWNFEESFEVEPFDNQDFYEVNLQDLEYALEVKKEDLIKNVENFTNH